MKTTYYEGQRTVSILALSSLYIPYWKPLKLKSIILSEFEGKKPHKSQHFWLHFYYEYISEEP